jgi:hypothetical protein
MTIDYTWEDNSCGTEIKIECFIGERNLPIWEGDKSNFERKRHNIILIIDEFTKLIQNGI